MTIVNLASEFRAAVVSLEQTGIPLPGDLPLYISGVGLQGIESDGDTYQPSECGQLALIVPVYNGPMTSFMRPIDEIPELIDLVAFRASNPSRWWRRTGMADYLSEHLIQSAVTWARPLRIHATPWDWLKARCDGICPLSQDYLALRCAAELRFDDAAFAARVQRALARPFPIPRILVQAA